MPKSCGKVVESLGKAFVQVKNYCTLSTSNLKNYFLGSGFINNKATALCPETTINPHTKIAPFNLLMAYLYTFYPSPINTNILNKEE